MVVVASRWERPTLGAPSLFGSPLDHTPSLLGSLPPSCTLVTVGSVQFCAHARSLHERDNWLTGWVGASGSGACGPLLRGRLACTRERGDVRARTRYGALRGSMGGRGTRARMLAVDAGSFPSSPRHSSLISHFLRARGKGALSCKRLVPRRYQRRVQPLPDMRFSSLQTATSPPPPPPPSNPPVPGEPGHCMPGNSSAVQLTRDGSVLTIARWRQRLSFGP